MIFNILDNTTELYTTKYIIGEIFRSGGATLYKYPSDQTVRTAAPKNDEAIFASFLRMHSTQKNVKKGNKNCVY